MSTTETLEELVAQIPEARPRELAIIEERIRVLKLAQELETSN